MSNLLKLSRIHADLSHLAKRLRLGEAVSAASLTEACNMLGTEIENMRNPPSTDAFESGPSEFEALRRKYADARSQLDVVQNHLHNECAKLSKAIANYVDVAQVFLPASGAAAQKLAGPILALPPLSDDFELVPDAGSKILTNDEHKSGNYVTLSLDGTEWEEAQVGVSYVVMARRKFVTVYEWANKDERFIEFHRVLDLGTDIRLRYVGGSAWRATCDGSYELPLCLGVPPCTGGAPVPTLRACYDLGGPRWRLA